MDVPLERFQMFVMDNPRHAREHVLGYLHRVAVGVGAIEPDEKPILERRMPRVPKAEVMPVEADPYESIDVPF